MRLKIDSPVKSAMADRKAVPVKWSFGIEQDKYLTPMEYNYNFIPPQLNRKTKSFNGANRAGGVKLTPRLNSLRHC